MITFTRERGALVLLHLERVLVSKLGHHFHFRNKMLHLVAPLAMVHLSNSCIQKRSPPSTSTSFLVHHGRRLAYGDVSRLSCHLPECLPYQLDKLAGFCPFSSSSSLLWPQPTRFFSRRNCEYGKGRVRFRPWDGRRQGYKHMGNLATRPN